LSHLSIFTWEFSEIIDSNSKVEVFQIQTV